MEWINVDYEKPPHDVEVLAYQAVTVNGKNYYYYYLCEWNAEEEAFFETETGEYRKITPDYWMHLPKPL